MLLRKVKLENFKKFTQLEHEFVCGINVVKGRFNEIGKSSFLDGIIVAMFENPKSTSKELDKYKKWGIDRRCRTTIWFEADSKKFMLEKDFESRTLRLAAPDMAQEWITPEQVAEKFAELLGTNSATLFLSTSCIRQDDVRDIESGKKEISKSLERIVTGGTENTVASQKIDKLNKHIDEMKKGLERPTKSPGPIANLMRQVNELQQRINTSREEVNHVENLKLKLVGICQQLADLEAKLGSTEDILEKNKRRQEIEDGIEKLDKEYEDFDRRISDIHSLQSKIERAASELQKVEGFTDSAMVQKVRWQLDEMEFKRRGINEDIPKRETELKAAQKQFGSNKLLVGLSSKISLIVGGLVAALGFLGTFFNTAIAAVGVVALIFLIVSLWSRISTSRGQSQISDLKKRIEQMKAALVDIDEQEREILKAVQCDTLEEFEERKSTYERLVADRDGFQNQLKGKLGEETEEQISDQKRDILKRLGVEQEKLTDDLRNTRLSQEEYVKHDREVKELRNRKSELERIKLECEVTIGQASIDAEILARQEEECDVLKNNLVRMQKKVRIYEVAKDFIDKARTETLVSIEDLLQHEIQKNFEVFSNGKYKEVAVSEGTLDFQIFSEEKGGLVQPEELSGGAIDEFYLACRLALVRLIYGELKPPLIIDDPFVNFDQIRLAHTLEFLHKLGQEHQIIIFALSDDYDSIADKCIELL